MKHARKLIAVSMAAMLGMSVYAPAAYAGWEQKNGKYYYVDDSTNQKIVSKWIHTSSGYYYIGSDGYMVTGWCKINGNWHYFRENGLMATGWRHIKNKWYYLQSNGVMQTGWLKLTTDSDTKWYYLKDDGVMATGGARSMISGIISSLEMAPSSWIPGQRSTASGIASSPTV